MTDDVQAEAPAPGEDGGTGLFDSYLQSVPSEHREVVEGYLKNAATTVDSKLQEVAELRKTYEPYAQAGYGPEEIAQLVGWHQEVTSSEEKYREFLQSESKAAGLVPEAERTPEENALADLTPNQIEEQAKRLSAVEEQIESDRQTRLVEQESGLLRERFDAFEKEHGLSLTEKQRGWIMATATAESPNADEQWLAFGHDWVTPGFDAYLELRADAQKEFVDGKAKQPAPAVSAGGVAAVQASTSWADVRKQAEERMRQART